MRLKLPIYLTDITAPAAATSICAPNGSWRNHATAENDASPDESNEPATTATTTATATATTTVRSDA